MFMVLSKAVQEMRHAENVTCIICGTVILVICAIYLAFFIEKRLSAYEAKQRIVELRRLQERKNEIIRETEGFEKVDAELKGIIQRQKEELAKKTEIINEQYKLIENYRQQLDEIDMGTFSGRSLKHG